MIKLLSRLLFFFTVSLCLQAEEPVPAQQKKLRFFNLGLHISDIADVKAIFNELGHEVVDWSLSGHTWVFGRERDKVDVVNEHTWQHLTPEMCDAFYERYKDFLEQFDAFLVTYNAPFALLYEKCNKPIVVFNTMRYEWPFTYNPTLWDWVNKFLVKSVKQNKSFLVSNNKADQAYLKYYTGLDSEHIPSLCLYLNAEYTGNKDTFAVHSLQFNEAAKSLMKHPEWIKNPPYPHTWQELYDSKAIIHFPYNATLMSVFEQYTANVPLFFPSKNFLRKLHAAYPYNILRYVTYRNVGESLSRRPGEPTNLASEETIDFWLNNADFYDEENMPYIQYFDSFEALDHMLHSVDFKKISTQMKEHNKVRKEIVFKRWQSVLDRVTKAIEE